MSNATAKNEIQEALQEFLPKRKAEGIADEIIEVIQSESKYLYKGTPFFAHEVNGKLIHTKKSVVWKRVLEMLREYLITCDQAREVFDILLKKQILNVDERYKKIKLHPADVFTVEGSDSEIYKKMLVYEPKNDTESKFREHLLNAVNANIETFEVPFCDPSIDNKGNLQFVIDKEPAVAFSYTELEKLEEKSGLKLGNVNQWYLYVGTLVKEYMVDMEKTSLHKLEYSDAIAEAMNVVCSNSKKYYAIDARLEVHYTPEMMKKTGLGYYPIYDVWNTRKILAKDQETGVFGIAGGAKSLTKVSYCSDNGPCKNSVGWFIL